MMNLNASAVIPANTQSTLDAMPENERSSAWNSKAGHIVGFKAEVMLQGLAIQKLRCVWCTVEVA